MDDSIDIESLRFTLGYRPGLYRELAAILGTDCVTAMGFCDGLHRMEAIDTSQTYHEAYDAGRKAADKLDQMWSGEF